MRTRKPIRWEVDERGCHNCTSHCANAAGYTVLKISKRTEYLHRLVYEEHFGKIPDELVVRHKCDNRRCINPDHLELGTHYDNVVDRLERDRQLRGEGIGTHKLSEEQARKIKYSKQSNATLAAEYGVDDSLVSLIKNGKRWAHI